MPEIYRVIWSLESSEKVQSIKEYLLEEWSENEFSNFLKQLKKFEKIVTRYPKLYPSSIKHPKFRRAVITKFQSVIYEIDDNIIKVHTILDHRQSD